MKLSTWLMSAAAAIVCQISSAHALTAELEARLEQTISKVTVFGIELSTKPEKRPELHGSFATLYRDAQKLLAEIKEGSAGEPADVEARKIAEECLMALEQSITYYPPQ